MKKLLSLVLPLLLIVVIAGCSTETEPDAVLEEETPPVAYPYNDVTAEMMEGIELFRGGERTVLQQEEALLQKVATLIENADYIEGTDINREISQLGLKVYLKEEIMGSRQVTINALEGEHRHYIGPTGREFLIESQELTQFLEENFDGKLLIVDEGTLQKEAKEWLTQFRQEKGAYVYQHPDATYIKIITEERPTGGYNIVVREFNENVYPQEIIIEVKEPDADHMTTQAITFPTTYLKVDSQEATKYIIKTVAGEVYDVEDILIFSKLETPEGNDAIPNPVRVKGSIIAFEGSFVVRILDGEGNLVHEEILQADAGGPAWGDFDEEISYPTPSTERGSLEIGEYSAKDGSYIVRQKVEVRFQ